MTEGFSLFVDGLPLEMTWDWLLQVFRGIGEISDVFVSQKTRSNRDCRFGFVRFKFLQDAKKAVRDLNGILVRGKKLSISFAKYDRNGNSWNSEVSKKVVRDEIPAWREAESWKNTNGVKSFKEVVQGEHQQKQEDDWARKSFKTVIDSESSKWRKVLHEGGMKVMISKAVEEIFQIKNLEEFKRRLVTVMVEAITKIQREETVGDEDQTKDKGPAKVATDEREKEQCIFLEDELVRLMR